MKKILCLLLAAAFITVPLFSANAGFDIADEIGSAILIEPETMTVLYEKNADARMSPASVTKVMTALLVMEAIAENKLTFDSLITVSAEASGMGGSQIFLEIGEKITVSELLKGMMVASGNDAAVAFAEAIGGSEDGFVDMMNKKAKMLGLENTHFVNCHGLDADEHYTSARDMAVISAKLLEYENITEYTSIWTDYIRNGRTALANTNKLVRFYDGCDGLKTGSTSIAKCCISATAKKGNMRLIAVVLGAPNTDMRFAAARQMLDYGFALKDIAEIEEGDGITLKVKGGTSPTVKAHYSHTAVLCEKGASANAETVIDLPECLNAPVKCGDVIGKIYKKSGDKVIVSADISVTENVDRITFGGILKKLLIMVFFKKIC